MLGEGAGVLILEELGHAKARGAKIYAELVGYGMSGDAYHMTAPAPGGALQLRSMENAIRDAGLAPDDISYVNAHGTSTHLNDMNETAALKTLFGERAYQVPVSSTKSMIGHLLGAAGALEAIVCALSIRDQKIHPTINLKERDPECDMDYVAEGAREADVNVAMSNSFGFGGHNAVIVLRRYEE